MKRYIALIVFIFVGSFFAEIFSVQALTIQDKPKFVVRSALLGGRLIKIEIADTEPKRAFGLMFREKLPQDSGMLFEFESEEQRSFWMMNTLIPLSIGYFDKDLVLREVIDMQPAVMGVSRPKTYTSQTRAKYALEMNIGWYEKNKIRPGAKLRFSDNDIGSGVEPKRREK